MFSQKLIQVNFRSYFVYTWLCNEGCGLLSYSILYLAGSLGSERDEKGYYMAFLVDC
jgi:hypothetical protein